MLCSYPIQLKLCTIVDYMKQITNILFFNFCTCSREVIDISLFEKNNNKKNLRHCLFLGHCCSEIFQTLFDSNLAQCLHFHFRLVTLTLFQGHSFFRNIICKLCFLDFCLEYYSLQQFKCCMVAADIKKIMHNMNCVMLVCVQGRQFMCFWSVMCLDVSKL